MHQKNAETECDIRDTISGNTHKHVIQSLTIHVNLYRENRVNVILEHKKT